MSERWKNEKLMPGEKVIDNSKDSTELMKNKNMHQTYID
jgi:hypothetical protein